MIFKLLTTDIVICSLDHFTAAEYTHEMMLFMMVDFNGTMIKDLIP